MKTITLLIFAAALSSLVACQKDSTEELIFGVARASCAASSPECSRLFRLTRETLEEEVNDVYPEVLPPASNDFSFVERSSDDHREALVMLERFPTLLLDQSSGTIGRPDAFDQGGCYIRYTRNGTTQTWWIDPNNASIPAYLHTYINLMQQKVEDLD